MKKKILIFSVAYVPFIGGAEVAVQEITRRLGDNFSFDLLTVNLDGKQKREEMIDGVRIFRIGSGTFGKFLFPFRGFFKAIALEKKEHYDIAWSIMASQASIAAAFFKIFKPKIALVLTLQEGDEEEHLMRYAFGSEFVYKIFIRPWYRLVFKRATVVTAISQHLFYRAKRNNAKAKIHVIPNGVNVSAFTLPNFRFERERLRHQFGFSDSFVLVTTSRLVKKNAVHDIIEALRFLPESVSLLIVGDGTLRSELELQVSKLNFDHRVRFTGAVSPQEIPSYLAAGDIFVRPSLSEGMGNSFIEAMAAGLPVVATPVGGIPDFLKDKETGIFCQVANPASIAEKIELLIGNKSLFEKVKTGGFRVAKEHDWGYIAKDMEMKVFRPLL